MDDMGGDGASGVVSDGTVRFLKILVTVLTSVMIFGVLAIVGLLVMRLQAPSLPAFPDNFDLPEGAVPMAVTRGPDWFVVVTEDGRVLILDPAGQVTREIDIR